MITTVSQEHELRPIEVIVKDPDGAGIAELTSVQHTPTAAKQQRHDL